MKVVLFRVDNLVVVEGLYSQEAHLMHLVKLLVFFASVYGFWFTTKYVPGQENGWADAISRDKANLFLPQAARSLVYPPQPLIDFISQEVPWTSTTWIKNTIWQCYPTPPTSPTELQRNGFSDSAQTLL